MKTDTVLKVLFAPSSAVTEHSSRKRPATIFAGMSLFLGTSSFVIAPLCDQAVAIKNTGSEAQLSISPLNSGADNDASVQQLRQSAASLRGYQGSDAGLVGPQVVAQRVGQWQSSVTPVNSGMVIPVPAPRTYTIPTQARPRVATGTFNYSSDRATELVWPARGSLSSRYGRRWGRMHQGIDIAGPIGTPIVAAADGVVVVSGYSSGGYGNVIDIEHADGSITRYGHNNRLFVGVGTPVRQGQMIAEMGNTGRSTGPHLHFEFHPGGGRPVNPMAYLPSGSS